MDYIVDFNSILNDYGTTYGLNFNREYPEGEVESPDRPVQGDERAAGQQSHGEGVVALSRHIAPSAP